MTEVIQHSAILENAKHLSKISIPQTLQGDTGLRQHDDSSVSRHSGLDPESSKHKSKAGNK